MKKLTVSERLANVEDAVFNHIPHKLRILNIKVTMMVAFGAFSLALLGIVIALVK